MTNFIVYMVGMLLLAGALAYGASLAGISQRWIVVGVLALWRMVSGRSTAPRV